MTRNQFVSMLKGMKGATFATLFVDTEPAIKSPKTSGMGGRIRKQSEIRVCLNFIYGNAVNRQRDREGVDEVFTPKPRPWGTRIQGTTLVSHKGKLYLETKVEGVKSTQYLLDGKPVEYSQISQYLRPKSTKSRQGVEKKVILRDYAINNIAGVHMMGQNIYFQD